MKLILILSAFLISGCSMSEFGKASAGGAIYDYHKIIHSDGSQECTARATSSREVMGATIKIGSDCSFETVIDEAASPFEVMDRMLDMAVPK